MKNLVKKTGKLLVIAGILLSTNKILTYGAANNNAVKSNTTPITTPSSAADLSNKVRILSDEAKYDRKNQTALANGHVKIIQDNITIFTKTVLYNQGIHTSFIDQFVRIIHLDKETKRKTDISANKMIVYHQDKKVHLENDVRFDREEDRKFQIPVVKTAGTERDKTEQAIRRERTVITSKASDYWTKSGDAIFTGDVVVLQKEKKALGDVVTVKNDSNKNTDTITLDKNAKLIQIKGEWLAREGIINPKEDKEKERLVKERLEMNADNIVIFQKTSNVVGNGNVKIVQNVASKHREATAEHAVFDDIQKTMTLTGNVRIKKENDDWQTSEKAVFHTDSENFEAGPDPNSTKPKQRVDSVFTIPDEGAPASDSPIGPSEPDFNLENNKKNTPPVIPQPPKVLPTVRPVPRKTPTSQPSPTKINIPGSKPLINTKPTAKPDINPYATPIPVVTPAPVINKPNPQPVKTPEPVKSAGEFSIPGENN